jgi:hypothetical protein
MVVNDSSKKGVCNDSVAPIWQILPSELATSEAPVTIHLDNDVNTDEVTYHPIGQRVLLSLQNLHLRSLSLTWIWLLSLHNFILCRRGLIP